MVSIELISIAANTINIFLNLLKFLIIVRIFMSWLAPRSQGKIAYFVFSTTEPILSVFRKLPLRIGMIDLSPLIAFLVLDFVQVLFWKFLERALA